MEAHSLTLRSDSPDDPATALLPAMLLRVLTAPEKDLHIRQIMDEGQVLLVNLAKGRLGEDSSTLLGGLLVTTIGLAAFSRADTPAQNRKDFFVYVDEFLFMSTSSRASRHSRLSTCFPNCVSTVLASR